METFLELACFILKLTKNCCQVITKQKISGFICFVFQLSMHKENNTSLFKDNRTTIDLNSRFQNMQKKIYERSSLVTTLQPFVEKKRCKLA